MSGAVIPFPGGDDQAELIGVLEALLFAAGEPVPLARLGDVLPDTSRDEILKGLRGLEARLEQPGRGLMLAEVAGGWQLRTATRHGEAVARLLGGKATKLSRAALEVLAVVAYRQPVTRKEIEEVRGVSSGAVLKSLLDRGILSGGTRREELGHPLEYRTTRAFLELFALRDLKDLPTLRELRDLQ